MEKESEVVLRLSDIDVNYDETRALSGLNLELNKGEIHAVVGEHRSGKSSITKLLGGMVRKQSGTIELRDKMIDHMTPPLSIKNKIGIIYQDADLIPSLTGVENIYAGRFILNPLKIINNKEMTSRVSDFLEGWNLSIDLRTPVGKLPKADQHKLELVRAVFFDQDILIFDEISNKLNTDELEMAYQLILNLKNSGKSVLYISNNMNEIFEFADRVSVLKNGRVISTQKIANVDKVRLIDLTYSFAHTREELRKSNQELYNFKKYNEDIINNLPLGVIILDPEKKVYMINHSALEILSLENRKDALDFDGFSARLPVSIAGELEEVLESRDEKNWEEVESAGNKYLNISAFPFKDEDYFFLGTIILIQDISRDLHMKNYLLQTERISSIAELAAGVAHEVNNPLGIILNYVELLNLHKNDEYSKDKIIHIKNELNRIKSIIGSLLSFAHLNETPMRPVKLGELIDETLILLNHRFKEKAIEPQWVHPEAEVLIKGNENRLKQVIINIIINAIEAVTRKGHIEIQLRTFKDKPYTDLLFMNNGPPIDPEVLKDIFNPFFSTKTEKNNTGLGLSICQHIIEAHQGLITCESDEKQTCFRIRLPLLGD